MPHKPQSPHEVHQDLMEQAGIVRQYHQENLHEDDIISPKEITYEQETEGSRTAGNSGTSR